MPFDKLDNKENPQRRRERISQRDLLPKAVKLRNSEIYSLGEGTVIIYDMFGNPVLKINQDNDSGTVAFGGNAYINYVTGVSSFANSKIETYLQAHPQHTDSWTNSSTYTAVVGSINTINFDELDNVNVYLEMVCFTDAGTGYFRLYNQTDGAELTGSEISTTSTSRVILRSGVVTKPTGTKDIRVQFKIVDGGAGFVNAVMSRIVFRSQ